ncbi:MAG TPA: hypothetical protein VLE72_03120 [Candidatus Saccharimonadales bacterium]|nr:hypothetical protein [Candidatus Saccharimonadales bacterium]
MSDQKVTLPDRDEMLERLLSVSDDSARVERLYPVVLGWAGREFNGQEIAFALGLACSGFLNPFGITPMRRVKKLGVKKYLRVLIDDQKVLKEALSMIDGRAPSHWKPIKG